ncbi:toll/interleukin-1 receptor domain-containing protein [Rhodococcus tibetensis]|uniref:Toll/interleukin-1 receptor domain-containing protein n=1 Tax=Rhodococcus tibetensis TaxID=2965064 RepID=A0ABT1QLQ4_9NOCA|nr:toll/interleukin-1 receptor domain-containing protein [Rhodococcus sp. FXJ9.536]MCQ4122715.1 toll/interleukin-1 receptor domain-containing protein [Rhodococcus sp. FXJ9.536]
MFLSHASEDKDAIARPLKDVLEALDLNVWDQGDSGVSEIWIPP